MTLSCEKAFVVVDVIRDDVSSKTRGVDAFSLALIRSERQIRRIFTNIVFQATAFERSQAQVPKLREVLAKRRNLYFHHFRVSFDELVGIPISTLVDNFPHLSGRMDEATSFRNKIFHGQLTGRGLSTAELLSLENDIRTWCLNLSDGAHERFGYDGFAGDTSFTKSGRQDISQLVDRKIGSVDDYRTFLIQLEKKGRAR